MRPWRTFKRLLAHCRPRPKVGLRRRKVQLHARSREGPDDCRRQQVNCASFLPSSKAFVSPLTSWEPFPAIFLQVCWFRYSNESMKGPQSCINTSSQMLPSIIIFLGWRKLRNVRKSTMQILILALEGARAIQNFDLKELIIRRCQLWLIERACSLS